jgi:hypothetical protein
METRIKARDDFGSVIARAGLTREQVSRASQGVSTRTIDALARPGGYGRAGYTREVTAWRIARAFAALTEQTAESAFSVLFVEVTE